MNEGIGIWVGLMVVCGLWALSAFFPLGFGRDTQISYEKITQNHIKNRIKKRFKQPLQELRQIGFQGHCYYREILGSFSLISSFLLFVAMYGKKEVLEIRSPLRFATGYPLLDLPNHGTFAVVYVLETKFLTLFTDGTTLITGTEGRIPNFVDENFKVYRQGASQTVMEAWHQHQIRVEALKAEGKKQKEDIKFSDYADILTKVETILLANNFFRKTEGWGDGMMG